MVSYCQLAQALEQSAGRQGNSGRFLKVTRLSVSISAGTFYSQLGLQNVELIRHVEHEEPGQVDFATQGEFIIPQALSQGSIERPFSHNSDEMVFIPQ